MLVFLIKFNKIILPITPKKIKANKKGFTVLKCTCKGLQKSIGKLER